MAKPIFAHEIQRPIGKQALVSLAEGGHSSRPAPLKDEINSKAKEHCLAYAGVRLIDWICCAHPGFNG